MYILKQLSLSHLISAAEELVQLLAKGRYIFK